MFESCSQPTSRLRQARIHPTQTTLVRAGVFCFVANSRGRMNLPQLINNLGRGRFLPAWPRMGYDLGMKIKIFVTGGTIDDLEYDSLDKAPKNHQSLIQKLLQLGRLKVDYQVGVLMQKDSRFVTDEDRKLIYKKCQEAETDRIVVTHGTLTMPDTAKYLGAKKLDKTVVFLGSAIPANKDKSDALFNLGAAITAVQLLPHGVYVTMNGKIFSWDNVRKHKGYFEEER